MMFDFDYPPSATRLNPTHITTRGKLDRWEQENINDALAWIDSQIEKHSKRKIYKATL
jgi:hypothetical protein